MIDIQNLKEFSLAETGDLVIKNGDFALSSGQTALADHIMVRLKTYLNTALAFPNVGSTIEEFAGLPNTRETGVALEEVAYEALTRDGFLDRSSVVITAVPDFPTHVTLYVDPDPNDTGRFNGTLSFDIDLSNGSVF